MQSGFAWTPDSKYLVHAITEAENGIFGVREFRAFPVGGGPVKVIPLKGINPGFAPDGRFTYTANSRRSELWMASNLLPKN